MANTQAVETNHAAKTKKRPPRDVPEERFWIKYSRHHELPLSTASSVLVHALAIGVIVLGAILVGRINLRDKSPEIGTLALGGGGGNPQGVGDGKNTGVLPAGPEKVEVVKDPTLPLPDVKKEALPTLNPAAPVIPEIAPLDNARPVEAATQGLQVLAGVQESIRQRLDRQIAGKGKGGPGQGGGQGSGIGTGKGPDIGPGEGRMDQRQKRQLRWVMQFNTLDGRDYANQLQSLGAILAVPKAGDSFLVIRDLKRRPAAGKEEELSAIGDRIYWVDDKQQSVHSLATALGIAPPPFIAAFFPKKLEDDLLVKELDYFKARRGGGTEDMIRETRFKVRKRGSSYDPEVESQTSK